MNQTLNPKYLKLISLKSFYYSGFSSENLAGHYHNLSLLKTFEKSILIRELRINNHL